MARLVEHGCKPGEVEGVVRLASIFQDNAFNVEDPGGIGQSYHGLFPAVSHINHSCVPNSHTCYDFNKKRMTIYSIRDIENGDEICITYFDMLLPREQRRAKTRNWGFECDCPACNNNLKTSLADYDDEKLRSRIKTLEVRHTRLIRQGEASTIAEVDQSVSSTYEMVDLVNAAPYLAPQLPLT